MYKIITMLFLVGFSSSVFAEWNAIFSDSTTNFYADTSSVHKNGDIVTVSTIFDLKASGKLEGSNSFFSLKGKNELDCKQGKSRTSEIYFYSENMGRGIVVRKMIDKSAGWEPISPRSPVDALWNFACGSNISEEQQSN